MRRFATNLYLQLEEDYKNEITEIKALLGGDGDRNAAAMPMGNVDAEYYGWDIAEAQTENASAALIWLDSMQTSLEALINAALVTSENLAASDGDTAEGIEEYFRTPSTDHPNLFPGITPEQGY
ncbi:hypothetical protein ACFQ3B_05985 [Stackebrandtia endophytica]|nr:hypothetical protein [Stackebrandtia endophytica]